MKYLESLETWRLKSIQLREFCDNYLAYLLDDYIKISFYSGSGTLILIDNKNHGVLEWDKLKDHFIPFLYMLEREYSVINIGLGINSEVPTKYNLSDIDSEKFKIKTLFFINITLKL